jgi:FtsX-like permease family
VCHGDGHRFREQILPQRGSAGAYGDSEVYGVRSLHDCRRGWPCKRTSLDDEALAHQYQAYYSLDQDPDQWVAINYADATVVIRTPLEPASLLPALKGVVQDTVGDQPIYNVRTMREIASSSMARQRLAMFLLGAFAVLSLLLATVGLYGVISYSVTQRVREIGVRIALGADQGSVLRMIIWQHLRVVTGGHRGRHCRCFGRHTHALRLFSPAI